MSSNTEHFVAPVEETPLLATDTVKTEQAPLSLWADAWRKLRRRPMFIISALLILLLVVVALFPGLFTNVEPNNDCQLANSEGGPTAGHPLGFTLQGCDVYSRVIHGTQASLSVGILSVLCVIIIGVTLGALAGYYGGWLDAVLARLGDIFFALPIILGALVITQLPLFRENRSVWTVVLTISLLAWPQMARITRGAVIEVRNADFVTAARSLGVSKFGALVKHALPNALAPVIVLATLELGVFIVLEATLSFLGVGLPTSVMSWGNDISAANASIRTNPGILLYPAAALSITVLSFIMLGDAVRDALDPKSRQR
ncbi:ABC transporter permease [Arthrobacter sp. TES]|jgi:oligopeptide transport system permease protein|uniref:ABC transporter permease n=1 Tax=Paenarthrobacter ureafaciens TaxID=37931 RepID=A0AAX3EEW6_PAEUR|nr:MULTISPECIES: ABC transporter permease [Paenarthrobacter]AMB41158.1 peptide ABC transporter permease [Arthrobacter sp. ATCC 21022]AOY70440.1 peptide ABC transporter permease [Arthrobacter sp. ZXY-2]ERI38166.1 peptide ABC transporter permease [Arthrobacter sp. AK-YN10]NKR13043.1 peptide ABC transporter permease [Arthrobacter sp. M5]NKR17109.1 peptide ABC transporter permease [Arthrobacter sp. M6]OEH62747.1 peptide ABC transporter permease [Arthrobacter sp. D4]OEH63318.1 peptide ABC transpo